MPERNKWAFWAFVLAALAVVCAPSTLLLGSLERYRRFLEGFEPVPIKPLKVRFVAHRGSPEPKTPKLEFVDFRLRAPKAKEVYLIGDFNGWKAGTLALARQPHGNWELVLPLPRGRYHYLYMVDGDAELDPSNRETGEAEGRRTSVKVVR